MTFAASGETINPALRYAGNVLVEPQADEYIRPSRALAKALGKLHPFISKN